MPARNVNLTEHFDHFIQAIVASGRFSNASEVVREGLRLLEQREEENRARVEWLRTPMHEAEQAIARGDYVEVDTEEQLDAVMQGLHKEAMARLSTEKDRAGA